MTGGTTNPTSPVTGDVGTLLDALLYSISHDLKSPLLTLSLSADLIVQATPELEERTRVAIEGLRHGAEDLTRMLDALTAVSSARRRPLQHAAVPLLQAMRGRVVRAGGGDLDGLSVAVDPGLLDDLLPALCGAEGRDLDLAVGENEVLLEASLPENCPRCEGPPLAVLFGSLTTYAGSPVESLAALQAQLERQGGAITLAGQRAQVRLPLATEG